MDELKKQAEELGIKVDGRWSAERLQAEIDEKLAADPEPEPQRGVDPIPETPVVEPVAEVATDEPEAPSDPVAPEPEASAIEGLTVPLDQGAVDSAEFTVVSLIENPMRAFGLSGKGSVATFTVAQLKEPGFVQKLSRAEEFGMVEIKAE